MSKRAPKVSKLDDYHFPVRVGVLVPEGGHGRDYNTMADWLDRHVGKDGYAWHSGPHGGSWEAGKTPGTWQTSHLYFRSVTDAAAFMTAFKLEAFAIGQRSYLPPRHYGWGSTTSVASEARTEPVTAAAIMRAAQPSPLGSRAMKPYRIGADIVEAVQYNSMGDEELIPLDLGFDGSDGWRARVRTSKGDVYASPGDWIVRNDRGDLKVIKQAEFDAMYVAI
jgi:hypothetical protein